MPVFNADNQATQDRVGASVRQFAYGLIAAEQNTDMAPSARADQELTSRGFISGEVTMQQALDVARALNADYAVYGRCNKQDRRVTFELSLANVRLSTLVKTQAGESARGDDLQQQVGEVIRVLLAAINRP
jgi:hypothetical protein